ncbi:MAG: SAM-dependent methyltransferase [Bacteroidota bacterium]
MLKGKLYLIPVTLGSKDHNYVIPPKVLLLIGSLRKFAVEDVRSARRFLRMVDPEFPIDQSDFMLLDKNTASEDIGKMLRCLNEGSHMGLMSEAGMPGIADPGAKLVIRAHASGVKVIPLTGPSSIFLALMSSGLNGQNFTFNGYLPINKYDRIREIKKLEKMAREGQSQIFMETPYRNMKLLDDIVTTLSHDTYLCIAASITKPDEYISTRSISDWAKKGLPDINKKPAIFIIGKKPF